MLNYWTVMDQIFWGRGQTIEFWEYVDSPFEITNFNGYRLRPRWKGSYNPCFEIYLEAAKECNLRVGREISSPFQLTSFTEVYWLTKTSLNEW